MRTTLSLDDDVASLLKLEMHRSRSSLKAAVNQFLRMGLMSAGKELGRPFVIQPRKLGLPHGLNYDSVAELIEKLEETTG